MSMSSGLKKEKKNSGFRRLFSCGGGHKKKSGQGKSISFYGPWSSCCVNIADSRRGIQRRNGHCSQAAPRTSLQWTLRFSCAQGRAENGTIVPLMGPSSDVVAMTMTHRVATHTAKMAVQRPGPLFHLPSTCNLKIHLTFSSALALLRESDSAAISPIRHFAAVLSFRPHPQTCDGAVKEKFLE